MRLLTNYTDTILRNSTKEQLKNRKFRIVANLAGHGWQIGQIVNFYSKDGRHLSCTTEDGLRYNVSYQDVEIIPEGKKEIENLLAVLENDRKKNQELLDFMIYTESDTIDPLAFEVYRIMKLVDDYKDDKEALKVEIYKILSENA